MIKKMIKIVGIVLLAVVGLIVFIFVKAALTPAVPKDYTATTKTGGDIEAAYLAMGTYEARYKEVRTDEAYKKYEIYYPSELETSDDRYPLVIFVNGTGIKASKYKALFRHLASWGFIVAGNEDESSGNGESTDKTLAYLLSENEDPDSIFYQKIDTDNIGLSGHSQGGAGVLSAITIREHKDLYKTAVCLSPTYEELAHGLGWNYRPEEVDIPILLLAGTKGEFEMETVIPTEKMNELYDKIPSDKIMARRKEAEHGDMLYQADGYVTAWFMYQLQNDRSAAKAFVGDDPELLNNALYQEQKIQTNK